jgi:ankyrin repeat protein
MLQWAIQGGVPRIVQTVIKSGKVDINQLLHNPRRYPIHDAVATGNIKIVVLFLNQPGINVHVLNGNGDSPIRVADTLGLTDISSLLSNFTDGQCV